MTRDPVAVRMDAHGSMRELFASPATTTRGRKSRPPEAGKVIREARMGHFRASAPGGSAAPLASASTPNGAIFVTAGSVSMDSLPRRMCFDNKLQENRAFSHGASSLAALIREISLDR